MGFSQGNHLLVAGLGVIRDAFLGNPFALGGT